MYPSQIGRVHPWSLLGFGVFRRIRHRDVFVEHTRTEATQGLIGRRVGSTGAQAVDQVRCFRRDDVGSQFKPCSTLFETDDFFGRVRARRESEIVRRPRPVSTTIL